VELKNKVSQLLYYHVLTYFLMILENEESLSEEAQEAIRKENEANREA